MTNDVRAGAQPTQDRDGIVLDLASAVREVGESLVLTGVGSTDLVAAAEYLRAATAVLARVRRDNRESSDFDTVEGRIFACVSGAANPVSPPLLLRETEDGVEGRCRLGAQYEGPRTFAHGGVSAMLMDEIMARVPEMVGKTRVTRSLEVAYHRPVPLGVDLLLVAQCVSLGEREYQVRGRLAIEDLPDQPLVTGEACFVLLSPEQAARWLPVGESWRE